MGRLDRKALATLVWVAPLNYDSGTLRGRRIIYGGPPPLDTKDNYSGCFQRNAGWMRWRQASRSSAR
jgi:hypothetical protein